MRVLMIILICAAAVHAGESTGGAIVVDGRPSALRYVVVDGRAWFPVTELGKLAGVPVEVVSENTLFVRGRTVACELRTVGGVAHAPREAVKQHMGLAIFVDAETARALVTTPGGVSRMQKTAAKMGTAPATPAETTRQPTEHLDGPAPPGAASGGQEMSLPTLAMSDIVVERNLASNNQVRVRAKVRNVAERALHLVTVTFLLWDEQTPATTCPVTGDWIPYGYAYSSYPFAIGDMAAGEYKEIDIQTTVGSPESIDAGARLIVLDISRMNVSPSQYPNADPFRKRKLKYGFKGETSESQAQQPRR